MPTVLDWSPTVDPSEIVRVVQEAIAANGVVVLPGDCGYVALVNPTSPNAARQLAVLAAAGGSPPAVLAWAADDPVGLGFPVSTIARRFMFRAWPGPVVVAVPGEPQWPSEWSNEIRAALKATGAVRFRCPEHPLCEAIIPALSVPALVVDTLLPTVEEVLDALNEDNAIAVSAASYPWKEAHGGHGSGRWPGNRTRVVPRRGPREVRGSHRVVCLHRKHVPQPAGREPGKRTLPIGWGAA
ncbi:MAG: Sua5/YciO/YrdC/YwlC family protein [Gemmataceae bacterium]